MQRSSRSGVVRLDLTRVGGAAVLAVTLLLEGCKGCSQEDVIPSWLTAADASPVGLYVGDAVGVGTANVPVFATNALGAAVPGVDITLTSTASVPGGALEVDSGGWAFAAVSSDAPGAFALDGTASVGTASGHAWIVPGLPGAFEYPGNRAGGDATGAAVAGGGVAWAIGDAIWWAGPEGGAPVRVASLGSTVAAIEPVEGDNDGITDLLAWSDTAVVLLRGRDGGGLYWGTGFTAAEGKIVGATVTDADGDAKKDLVVGLNFDGGTAGALILAGDGGWSFAASDYEEIPFPILSISSERFDDTLEAEITVLTEDGLIRRFGHFPDEGWNSTTTSAEYDLGIGEGSRLYPSTDLDGDGIVDIIGAGPATDQTGYQAWVLTAGGTSPTQYHMFSDDEAVDGDLPQSLSVSLGDLTGDGVTDLGMSTPSGFTRAAWVVSDNGAGFRTQTYEELPSGAVGLGQLVGDDVVDVALVGSRVTVVPGARDADDPATVDQDETVLWRPVAPVSTVFDLGALTEPWMGDFNGDGVVDTIAFIDSSGTLALHAFSGVPASGSDPANFHSGSVRLIATQSNPVDLAVCGATAWALVAGGDGTTTLHRYDISSDGVLTEDGTGTAMPGTALACGDFGSGVLAVVAASGAVTYVTDAGDRIDGTPVEGGVDAVAADLDGDGVDDLIGCAEDGCSLAAGDVDGDGKDDLVENAADGSITVYLADQSFTMDTTGVARLFDADGDGQPEVIVGDSSSVEVWSGVPGGLAPPSVRFIWRTVTGEAMYGDLDGDGLPDAFLLGRDPSPEDDVDVWTGTLIYAPTTATH